MQPITATGACFDGVSARPYPVTIRVTDRFEVRGEGVFHDWNLLDLRAADAAAPLMRVGPVGSLIRVEFTDATLAAVLPLRCPDLARRESEEGGTLRLVLWSIAAGVSVILVALFGVPLLAGVLAPMVPDAVEERLGAAVEGQIVDILGKPPLCTEAAGKAALDRLVAKLVAGRGLPGSVSVTVRRHKMANALTLPGARVIMLSDVLVKSETPDEFAAILAHELGHVATRDPTRSLIQSSGTAFLLSLVFGDLTGSTIIVAAGQAIVSAGYSRDAERRADAYAVDTLNAAGGNGAALASILERIAKDGDSETGAFLRSHPFTRERAASIRERAGPEAAGRRIIAEADWVA